MMNRRFCAPRFFTAPLMVALVLVTATPVGFAQEDNASEEDQESTTEENGDIAEKEREIDELTSKIESLRSKRDDTAAQAEVIDAQLQRINRKLEKARLELQQTRNRVASVEEKEASTRDQITALENELTERRERLRGLVQRLYQHEQRQSIVRLLLQDELSLSEVLAEQEAYEQLQERTISLISELRTKKEQLEEKQSKLAEQRQDLAQLAALLSDQRQSISRKQQQKRTFLDQKRQEQAAYEDKIAEAKEAREEIKEQVFRIRSGDEEVEVSLDNAFDMARFASSKTGVRPALLLGVMKVESNMGNNTGSGQFPHDMHPANRDTFLQLADELGFDPYAASISAKPASGYGWGGAMGPGQFMPNTWVGIAPRVRDLMGKAQVSPYELEDAFMATAIFLADRGAAAGNEREAVGRYIAGPNWQYYDWYIDRVFAVTREYQGELDG